MDISTQIKIMLTATNKTQSDLANALNCTQSNIALRLKNNAWKVKDLEEICKILGYKLEINFKKIDY